MENQFVASAAVQVIVRRAIPAVILRISVKVLKSADHQFSHAHLSVGAHIGSSHAALQGDEFRADKIDAAFRFQCQRIVGIR